MQTQDMYGKRERDYEILRDVLEEGGDPKAYMRERAMHVPALRDDAERSEHKFDIEPAGTVPDHTRATVGSEPFGFVVDRLSAVQTQVEETLYQEPTAEILDAVPIRRDIREGDSFAAFPVGDYTGSAGPLDDSGTDASMVRQSLSERSYHLTYGGNMVRYSNQEIAAAANMGLALPTATIEHASRLCIWAIRDIVMEGQGSEKGLTNQDTRAANATSNLDRIITRAARSGGWEVSNAATDPQEIANNIQEHIRHMHTDSNGTTEQIGGELVIGVPGAVLDELGDTAVSAYRERSILEYVTERNAWSARTGNNVRFMALTKLTNKAVMWINSPRVLEFGISIMPRVMEPQRVARGVQIDLEYKTGDGIAIKQPIGVKQITAVSS